MSLGIVIGVGATAGGAVLVMLLGLMVYCVCCKKRGNKLGLRKPDKAQSSTYDRGWCEDSAITMPSATVRMPGDDATTKPSLALQRTVSAESAASSDPPTPSYPATNWSSGMQLAGTVPAGTVPPGYPPSTESWACTACTFQNAPELAHCEMCNTPRADVEEQQNLQAVSRAQVRAEATTTRHDEMDDMSYI